MSFDLLNMTAHGLLLCTYTTDSSLFFGSKSGALNVQILKVFLHAIELEILNCCVFIRL